MKIHTKDLAEKLGIIPLGIQYPNKYRLTELGIEISLKPEFTIFDVYAQVFKIANNHGFAMGEKSKMKEIQSVLGITKEL